MQLEKVVYSSKNSMKMCEQERSIMTGIILNSLPKDIFLGWSKMKALSDVKINVTEELKLVLGKLENIMGKGENAGYQHFLLFP